MLLSRANPQSMAGKILLFPLTRIVIAALFLTPVTIIHFLFESEILPKIPGSYKTLAIGLDVLIGISLFLLLYKLYTKYIEKRKEIKYIPLEKVEIGKHRNKEHEIYVPENITSYIIISCHCRSRLRHKNTSKKGRTLPSNTCRAE